jgi:hypothetical protein
MDLDDLNGSVAMDATGTDRVTLGVALRGRSAPHPTFIGGWDTARKAGLPITMHCDRCMREAGCHRCNIASMREKGLLDLTSRSFTRFMPRRPALRRWRDADPPVPEPPD